MPRTTNYFIGQIEEWKKKINHIQTFPMSVEGANLSNGSKKDSAYERLLTEINYAVSANIKALFVYENDKKEEELPLAEKWVDGALGRTEGTILAAGKNALGEKDTDLFLDATMPAYYAMKEDYKSRSIFQWIFNHEKYTAVRDSYKALEKMIKTVTGKTQNELNEKYGKFKSSIQNNVLIEEIYSKEKSLAKNLEKEYILQQESKSKEIKEEKRLQDVEKNKEVSLNRQPANKKYLQPNYIPDFNNATAEFNEITSIRNELNSYKEHTDNGKTVYVSPDGKNTLSKFCWDTANAFLTTNHSRCETAMEHAAIKNKNGFNYNVQGWELLDRGNKNRNDSLKDPQTNEPYTAPDIMIPIKNENAPIKEEKIEEKDKVPVSISLNDGASKGVSKARPEEKQKNAPTINNTK